MAKQTNGVSAIQNSLIIRSLQKAGVKTANSLVSLLFTPAYQLQMRITSNSPRLSKLRLEAQRSITIINSSSITAHAIQRKGSVIVGVNVAVVVNLKNGGKVANRVFVTLEVIVAEAAVVEGNTVAL